MHFACIQGAAPAPPAPRTAAPAAASPARGESAFDAALEQTLADRPPAGRARASAAATSSSRPEWLQTGLRGSAAAASEATAARDEATAAGEGTSERPALPVDTQAQSEDTETAAAGVVVIAVAPVEAAPATTPAAVAPSVGSGNESADAESPESGGPVRLPQGPQVMTGHHGAVTDAEEPFVSAGDGDPSGSAAPAAGMSGLTGGSDAAATRGGVAAAGNDNASARMVPQAAFAQTSQADATPAETNHGVAPSVDDSSAQAASMSTVFAQPPVEQTDRSGVFRANGDAGAQAFPATDAGEASAGAGSDAPMTGQDGSGGEGRPSPDFVRFAAALKQVAASGDEGRAAAPVVGPAAPAAAAPAVGGPAAVAAAAPAAPAETAETPGADNVGRLVQAMRVMARPGAWEANVRLNPEHLGDVSIAVRVERNMVSAVVNAESSGVRQWLESQEQAMRNGMAEHGLQLERFVVQRDGQRREAPEHEQQQGRRSPRGRQPEAGERFEIVV